MALGEVYVSEAAKHIRLMPPPRVNVGVRTSGKWLELTVDAEGMSQAQLQKILTEYDPKKPYSSVSLTSDFPVTAFLMISAETKP